MKFRCDWMYDTSAVCEEEFDSVEELLDHMADHYGQVPPTQQEVPC